MRSLDPVTGLTFAIHASPGTYALLLGSGVSSAAGIPTGWAIVQDLIRRIASVEGADAGGDPEAWFVERFGEAPRYSNLLDQLARTPSERQAIIRSYIEPTDEQRRTGLRLPTKAHRAIANLVSAGYVKLVLTTNFDRLIEQALEEKGVSFDVIDGVDAIRGARPVSQSPCVVLKLHGDYRDARIRNTPAELDAYEPELDAMLDRVLDEYGLVVCGWSAEWDSALRAAITRQANRRFSTYWCVRGELTEAARALTLQRMAVLIPDRDADAFFPELEAKLFALADVDRPHPLTIATAVAELKRYLPDPQARIRLEDLVLDQTNRAAELIAPANFPTDGADRSVDEARRRLARYGAATEILAPMLSVGCSYSVGAEQDRVWSRAIERVADFPASESGIVAFIALRRYPALLCIYAAGLAAVGSEKWATLREVLLGRDSTTMRGEQVPLVVAVNTTTTFRDLDLQATLHPSYTGGGKLKTPISDYFHSFFKDLHRPFIASATKYDALFDRFEFLMGMVLVDCHDNPPAKMTAYVPAGYVGRYAWRYERDPGVEPAEWAAAELAKHGATWELLRAGLFDGKPARFEAARTQMMELARSTGQRWW